MPRGHCCLLAAAGSAHVLLSLISSHLLFSLCTPPAQVSLHEPCAADDYLGQLRRRSRRWRYDAALGPAATSAAVYAASAAPLVADVAAGAGNATVFCYGATGAGKTHTMLGTAAQPGVMVLAIAELFERLGSEPGAEVRSAHRGRRCMRVIASLGAAPDIRYSLHG